MSTAVIWSKSKPDVEFQYGGRFGEFHGTSSQSHLPHCRVLPPGEFNGMPSQSHVLQGVIIPSAILIIVFAIFYFIFVFLNALWALMSGGFRIVSGTLVNLQHEFTSVLIINNLNFKDSIYPN